MLSIVINTFNRPDMLVALLRSIACCTLPPVHEIIVVDDASTQDYRCDAQGIIPGLIWLRNDRRSFLIKSRNRGWRAASGEVMFFIDDDNEIVDRQFFLKGVELLSSHPDVGILGCRGYYFDSPNFIVFGPNQFNKMTGRTGSRAAKRQDVGQFDGLLPTFDAVNAFFVRQPTLARVGGFSDEIVQTLSEADFAEKVRHIGLRVCQASGLKVYHKSPLETGPLLSVRTMGGSPERQYFMTRNRFVLIKKWGRMRDELLFGLIFSEALAGYYVVCALRLGEPAMVRAVLLGFLDGFRYLIGGRLHNAYATS